MKELGRFLAANDILFPVGAAACLSTPMNETEIDRIVDAFEAFLANRPDAFAGLLDCD